MVHALLPSGPALVAAVVLALGKGLITCDAPLTPEWAKSARLSGGPAVAPADVGGAQLRRAAQGAKAMLTLREDAHSAAFGGRGGVVFIRHRIAAFARRRGSARHGLRRDGRAAAGGTWGKSGGARK